MSNICDISEIHCYKIYHRRHKKLCREEARSSNRLPETSIDDNLDTSLIDKS